VPARGLLQVRSRRYTALQGAVEASGASTRAAPRQLLKTARCTARRMAGAGGASTRAAPRQLLQAVRHTAKRMGAASAASRMAAPSQSLEAVCPADYVHRARSPTMRRRAHRSSLARPSLHGWDRWVRARVPGDPAADGQCWPFRLCGRS
jgi:hypothetical protein